MAIDEAGLKAVDKKISRYQGAGRARPRRTDEIGKNSKRSKKKALAAIALNTARLDYARLELEHCAIDSPLDGRVGTMDALPRLLRTFQPASLSPDYDFHTGSADRRIHRNRKGVSLNPEEKALYRDPTALF